jgi:hypothetical protein
MKSDRSNAAGLFCGVLHFPHTRNLKQLFKQDLPGMPGGILLFCLVTEK